MQIYANIMFLLLVQGGVCAAIAEVPEELRIISFALLDTIRSAVCEIR